MPTLGIELEGALTAQVSPGTSGQPQGCGVQTSPGESFSLVLQSTSRSADAQQSSHRITVVSPSVAVALSMPPVGAGLQFRGRLLYFRCLDGSAWLLGVTHRTSGASTYRTQGLLVLEAPDAEEITALTVQGEGSFEYAIFGEIE